MAKRAMKEKEIIDHLHQEGFKELKEAEKNLKWYKKASERPFLVSKQSHEKKLKNRLIRLDPLNPRPLEPCRCFTDFSPHFI